MRCGCGNRAVYRMAVAGETRKTHKKRVHYVYRCMEHALRFLAKDRELHPEKPHEYAKEEVRLISEPTQEQVDEVRATRSDQ